MPKLITFLLIIGLAVSESSLASYVITTAPRGVYGDEASFKSTVNEFYSSGSGSFSYYSGPRDIVYQFPDGYWVPASNGYVPRNAIVKEYINGRPLFYCRSLYQRVIYYGALVPGQGCFVQSNMGVLLLTNYDSLIPY